MSIQIVECVTAAQRRAFIEFQWRIYRGNPVWVPPLISERMAFYDKTKNPFFQHSDAAMFTAQRDGRIVGTIVAVENRRHLEKFKDGVGFFGGFECENDPSVAAALFDTAEAWLRARGLTVMRGPATLSLNDECGLLIDAFDKQPMVVCTYNPPYYPALVEGAGFKKAKDLYAWWVAREVADKTVLRFKRVSERAAQRSHFTIRSINLKKLDVELPHVMPVLYSGPWEKNWGHVTPTDAEIKHLVHGLAQFANPELTLVAEIDGKAVGIGVCLPNVNTPLRLAYPKPGEPELFTLAKFVWHRRKAIRDMRFIVLGVSADHRMSGIDAALCARMYDAMVKLGYDGGDGSWVLEDNDAMNRVVEMGGGVIYKTYRLYDRPIAQSTPSAA
jgi:GNAT superfamily N-acetyltransferase